MSDGAQVHEPLFERDDPIAVLGLGISGAAAARLASALGARVYASDAFADENLEQIAAELRADGIEAEAGGHDLPRILSSRLVVVSPGIDPATEVRRAIREAGLQTVAEVELAYRSLRTKIIGITGTNGKTTTTALTAHLLGTAGIYVEAAGNIGRPLSELAARDEHPDWAVVELSSFQLADLETFDPSIGVLLNLAPDHLDRYPDLSSYYADKQRLFANASDDSRWVLNGDDPAVLELARGVAGSHYLVSTEGPVSSGGWLDPQGVLRLSLEGRDESLVEVGELPLAGRHNVQNALLAVTAAALAGCSAADLARGLRSFEGLPHRLQPIGEFDEILWINDSKGTNVSATRVAIRAFHRPAVLLLGGRHKGETYTKLADELRDGARGVIAFGEAAPQIVSELRDVVPVRVASGIDAVVREAKAMAEPGDVVILSPACSSYDMFPNYAERGRAFERAVQDAHAVEASP